MTTEIQLQGLGQFAYRGFTLEHDGSIALFLLHEGEVVARFSQLGATPGSLQAECSRHLVKKSGTIARADSIGAVTTPSAKAGSPLGARL